MPESSNLGTQASTILTNEAHEYMWGKSSDNDAIQHSPLCEGTVRLRDLYGLRMKPLTDDAIDNEGRRADLERLGL